MANIMKWFIETFGGKTVTIPEKQPQTRVPYTGNMHTGVKCPKCKHGKVVVTIEEKLKDGFTSSMIPLGLEAWRYYTLVSSVRCDQCGEVFPEVPGKPGKAEKIRKGCHERMVEYNLHPFQ